MASSSTNEEVAQARACSLFSGGVDSESVVVVAQERRGRLGLPGTAEYGMKFSTHSRAQTWSQVIIPESRLQP